MGDFYVSDKLHTGEFMCLPEPLDLMQGVVLILSFRSKNAGVSGSDTVPPLIYIKHTGIYLIRNLTHRQISALSWLIKPIVKDYVILGFIKVFYRCVWL